MLLHEWKYDLNNRPRLIVDADGSMQYDKAEPTENITTWHYELDSFTPCGKETDGKFYSIVSDYLGTPTHAFDEEGKKVWERQIDCYGRLRTGNNKFVPFLYPGQYVDEETGLAYNRFRYYDVESGRYLSKDPIGLAGGLSLYNFTSDNNISIDPLGLMPWGEFMNGASATISAGGNSGIYSSSTAGHAEIKGLNDFANKGLLNGNDVVISDVTGHFSNGTKPVGVCSKCRSDIFGVLSEGGAKSVSIPVTKGNVHTGSITIQSEHFGRIQAEIDRINSGPGSARTKSDASWKVLQHLDYK